MVLKIAGAKMAISMGELREDLDKLRAEFDEYRITMIKLRQKDLDELNRIKGELMELRRGR